MALCRKNMIMLGLIGAVGVVATLCSPWSPFAPKEINGVQVRLQPQAPFKLTQTKTLMNIQMQEYQAITPDPASPPHTSPAAAAASEKPATGKFFILSGVDPLQSQALFNNSITKESLQLMSNTALPLVKPSLKERVVIDTFESKPTPDLETQGQVIEQRRVSLHFHLENKPDTPRGLTLQVGRIKTKSESTQTQGQGQTQQQPTLIIWFSGNPSQPVPEAPLKPFLSQVEWTDSPSSH